METPFSKICLRCGETKRLTEFYRVGAGRRYPASQCKSCYNYNRLEKWTREHGTNGTRARKLALDDALRNRIQQLLNAGETPYSISKLKIASFVTIKSGISEGLLIIPIEEAEEAEE